MQVKYIHARATWEPLPPTSHPYNRLDFITHVYAIECIVFFSLFACLFEKRLHEKSLLQFTKSFPISREEWPHWQQCSTDLTISSPPPPMCKCFVIKEQLHSAFTVLDGGCCPSIFFFLLLCPPSPAPPQTPHTPPPHHPTRLPFLFFVDVEIVSALCSFSGDQWVGLCLGEWERRCGGTVCASRIERDEMPARVARTCGLVRVLGSPVVSAFSHLSNLSSLLKRCETSKCSEYLYSSFVPSLLVSDSMWMLCLSECSVLSSSPPLSLCEDVMLRSGLCGVGDSESEFASELWGWCGECLDQFPSKDCVWSVDECIFYVLWLEGKSEIKSDFD